MIKILLREAWHAWVIKTIMHEPFLMILSTTTVISFAYGPDPFPILQPKPPPTSPPPFVTHMD